ncbi:cytochrome P450 [Nocardia sp. NPDC059177]|uniref:cytochrome P450 n=1 Tax=Nocardia sp. NPDC059177 TaxID=3346759 RepID=UPI00368A33B4
MSTPTGACPVTGAIPLSGPEFHIEPHEVYRRMRRERGPVVSVELPGGFPAWLIIGYRELHQVTSDPLLFPRDVSLWNQWGRVPEDWPLLPMVGQPRPSIYFTAGAEHQRHLAMVEPALDAVDHFELRRACEELADGLIDQFCGRGTADLVAEFAEALPVLALSRILGLADTDAADLVQVMKSLADGGADAHLGYARFAEHMARLVATKKQRPAGDLASVMLADPGEFTDEEYMNDLMAIMAAGQLPSADWIGSAMRLMLVDDRFAAALGGGRRSVGQAMSEVLWEEGPTSILCGRWAARDTRLADQTIRAGDMLLLGLAAANLDPHIRQSFTDGDTVPTGNNAHFAFSYGEYRCPFPAQQIAEIIARTGIEVLLDRLPDVDLAVPADQLTRRPSAFLRGMTSLPVRFTPVRPVGGSS